MNIGVLFDLDGVLIDTESLYTQFWSEINNTYPTGVDNFAYKIKGSNLERILTTYYPDTDSQKEILNALNKFEEEIQYRIFPGVIKFLSDLKNRGIPTALVTSSDIEKMRKLYNQHPSFKNYFDSIITGDMVSKSKPNPECFFKGASQIGIPTTNCYVFEDSPSGIKAGLDCGAKVIALATTLLRQDIDNSVAAIIDSFVDFDVEKMLLI
ncbi:MAG: HAD family hydrolase [Muribaculaceae bacterium]|nr:HAD family hydrolase [Muribaculaceae bacterium]